MLCNNKSLSAAVQCLTFDLQADLVVGGAQDAAGHTGVGALVLRSGPFDL